jgi:hypothetical protein
VKKYFARFSAIKQIGKLTQKRRTDQDRMIAQPSKCAVNPAIGIVNPFMITQIREANKKIFAGRYLDLNVLNKIKIYKADQIVAIR